MVSCFQKRNVGICQFSSIESKSRHTTTHVVYVIGYTKCTQTLKIIPYSRFDTDSVFLVGIWLVFLGIYQTDTGGKHCWYISVLFFWWESLFLAKGGHGPHFEGPSPHFEEKRVSRQTLKRSCQIL
jgi:hypothetical protein